ncbi:hypothetical protein CBS101457_000044 [Exobasidium rhododendri]|nr:hypothetical protein CBS101457_000044 [Exobasidium rhododendri]
MLKTVLTSLFALSIVCAHPIDTLPATFIRRKSGNNYPPALQTPPQSSLPQAWIDALNAATAAGKIPDISPSTIVNGNPVYPNNIGNSEDTCNWTISKCLGPNDVSTVPDNEWTVSFDDGPTGASSALYDYLHQNNQAATHFMIGSQILSYQSAFKHAMVTGQQAAVHTWSHTLMSSKTNMELLGELGWNMQIIYDLSGRIPTLWRPPQGDVDNRVRAVAENVFNLTTVMWSAECNDWCIQADGTSACPTTTPGNSADSVQAAIQTSLHGSQSPGVTILEHELNSHTVGFFEAYYPSLAGLGWKPQAVSDHFGWDWYANAVNNDDTPINVTSIDAVSVAAAIAKNDADPTTTSSPTSATATATTASTSAETASSTTSSTKSTSTASPGSVSKQSTKSASNGAASLVYSTSSLYASAFFALMALVVY